MVKNNKRTQKSLKRIKNQEQQQKLIKKIRKQKEPKQVNLKVEQKEKKVKLVNKHYILKKEFKSLQRIPLIPSIYPTASEWASPVTLIERLEKEGYGDSYGAVKIVAPTSFKRHYHQLHHYPEHTTIRTREQELLGLKKGTPFKEHSNYTVATFRQYSQQLSNTYQYQYVHNQYQHSSSNNKQNNKKQSKNNKENDEQQEDEWLLKNEEEYWNLLQSQKKKVKIDYAADLDSITLGSYFQPSQQGLNLSTLSTQPNSLFQPFHHKTHQVKGVTAPWVYFGSLFSSFCWHVEDNYLHALNYQHYGAPKTWYFIPQSQLVAFQLFLQQHYQRKNKILQELTLQISPLELIRHNIKVYKTYQHAGEFILNLPRCYHCGFNNGYNINEAVNLATPGWLHWGRKSVQMFRKGMVKQLVFSQEFIIYHNAINIHQIHFNQTSLRKLVDEYELMMKQELQQRKSLKQTLNELKVQKVTSDLNRFNNDQCKQCKYYMQLSYFQCLQCFQKSCLLDQKQCNCPNYNNSLQIKVTEEEMKDIQKQLNKKLAQMDVQTV